MKIKEPSLEHYFDGEEVEIDGSIYELIMKFNRAGCKTFSCCSGLPEDHDGATNFHFYICFNDRINEKFVNHAESKGFHCDPWKGRTWIGINPNRINRTISCTMIKGLISDFNSMLDDDLKSYGKFGK